MNLVTALRGSVIALLMLAGAVPAHADERIGVIAAQLEPAPAGVGGAMVGVGTFGSVVVGVTVVVVTSSAGSVVGACAACSRSRCDSSAG